MATAAVIATLAGGAVLVVRARRLRQRSWLDVQLARLQARAGVPLEDATTLPRWLAGLPAEQRDEFEGIVRALEHEAWAGEPLHGEDRRWVEQKLEKVR
jgi:hypothetical protein